MSSTRDRTPALESEVVEAVDVPSERQTDKLSSPVRKHRRTPRKRSPRTRTAEEPSSDVMSISEAQLVPEPESIPETEAAPVGVVDDSEVTVEATLIEEDAQVVPMTVKQRAREMIRSVLPMPVDESSAEVQGEGVTVFRNVTVSPCLRYRLRESFD